MNQVKKPGRLALLLGAIVLVVLSVAGWLLWPQTFDTPFFRGTIDRRGYFPKTFLPRRPVILWSFTTASAPIDPIVVDGVVYAGDDAGSLYAIDAKTGVERWRCLHTRGQIFTSPAVVGDRIFYTNEAGVTAVSRMGGRHLWSFTIPLGATESSPLPVRDAIYVGGKDGKIYALAGDTGRTLWTRDILVDRPPDPPGFSSDRANTHEKARPRIGSSDGAYLYQPIFDQSRVIALDLKTGDLRWSFQAQGWIYGNPTVTDAHIFIGSQDKHLYCLDKATGAVAWKCLTGSRVEAGAAFSRDTVYFGSCDHRFYAVDAMTGAVKWSYKTGGMIYSSPLVTSNAVYFGSFDGYLYALSRSGEEKWKLRLPEGNEVSSTPSTDGHRLFLTVRGTKNIVAIGDSFWP